MNLNITSEERQYMRSIDPMDYYNHNKQRKILNCKICKCEISENNVFEHTVSKRHKYNKLLVAIVQGRSSNTDLDYIVLNINTVKCRYCDLVIVNGNRDDLVISHVENAVHVKKRTDWLNKIGSPSGRDSAVKSNFLEPLDSLIARVECKQRVQKGKNIEITELWHRETKGIANDKDDINNGHLNILSRNSLLYADDARRREQKLPNYVISTEKGTYKCTICLVQMPMHSYNIRQHIGGKKHNQNILINIQTNLNYQNKLTLDLINRLRRFHLPDGINIEESGAYKCTVCLTEIPRSLHDAKLHVNGKKHKQKLLNAEQLRTVQKLESQKMITSIPAPISIASKSSTYVSATCDISLTNDEHCKKLHDDRLEHNRRIAQLRICNENERYLSTQNSSGHISIVDNQYFCNVCNKFLPQNTSIIEHIKTEMHINIIECRTCFVLLSNGNWVRCKYCNNAMISNKYEHLICHIQSRGHTENKHYYLNTNTEYSDTLPIEHPTRCVQIDTSDNDFFEVDEHWVCCRYCNTGIIPKVRAHLHLWDTMHIRKKQSRLIKAAEARAACAINEKGSRHQLKAISYNEDESRARYEYIKHQNNLYQQHYANSQLITVNYSNNSVNQNTDESMWCKCIFVLVFSIYLVVFL